MQLLTEAHDVVAGLRRKKSHTVLQIQAALLVLSMFKLPCLCFFLLDTLYKRLKSCVSNQHPWARLPITHSTRDDVFSVPLQGSLLFSIARTVCCQPGGVTHTCAGGVTHTCARGVNWLNALTKSMYTACICGRLVPIVVYTYQPGLL